MSRTQLFFYSSSLTAFDKYGEANTEKQQIVDNYGDRNYGPIRWSPTRSAPTPGCQ